MLVFFKDMQVNDYVYQQYCVNVPKLHLSSNLYFKYVVFNILFINVTQIELRMCLSDFLTQFAFWQ